MPKSKTELKSSCLGTGNSYRRCHICGHIMNCSAEQLHDTSHCESCGKAVAKFYYFDLDQVPIYTDDRLRELAPLGEGKYRPLQGIVVHW